MNTNNPLWQFLQELFQRFSTKSPTFFKIFQLISSILVAITGLPSFIQSLGLTLPPALMVLENKAVAFAAMGVLFTSLLTSQSKVVDKTNDGVPIKETNQEKLPFTAGREMKAAEKNQEIGK